MRDNLFKNRSVRNQDVQVGDQDGMGMSGMDDIHPLTIKGRV